MSKLWQPRFQGKVIIFFATKNDTKKLALIYSASIMLWQPHSVKMQKLYVNNNNNNNEDYLYSAQSLKRL